LEEIDQKCTSEKVPYNLSRGLPPLFGPCPKENIFYGDNPLDVREQRWVPRPALWGGGFPALQK